MAAKFTRRPNLQRFLDSITPAVPVRSMPTLDFQDSDTIAKLASGKDTVDYFTLDGLWECYSQWSVYGVGTPFELLNGETVVQYYVPSLSAIQIYLTKPLPVIRNESEDSATEYCGWSNESENDMSMSWYTASADSSFGQDGALLAKEQLGHLYFQYFEPTSPFARVPLVDKVHEFDVDLPGLPFLKSIELSPASWMSFAWYPIYHIPERNAKELTACFLTYHTLSSCFQDQILVTLQIDVSHDMGKKKPKESSNRTLLPPFGLATYKMKDRLWVQPEAGDHHKVGSLFNAAEYWLKQLKVQHPNFNFFTRHKAPPLS